MLSVHSPEFTDARQALRFAFGMYAREIVSVSQTFNGLRGGVVSVPYDRMTIQDRIAQAGFILAFMHRVLGERDRDIIRAYYTIPDGRLENEKEFHVRYISYGIFKQSEVGERWYCCDMVRGWANIRPHHDVRWWSKHLDKREWKMYQFKRRYLEIADAWLDGAVDKLEDAMYENGMVSG